MRKLAYSAVVAGLFIFNNPPVLASEDDSPWRFSSSSQNADASDIALPIASFLLPGAGQWVRGQIGSGSAYSLTALAGYSYASNAAKDLAEEQLRETDLTDGNVAVRKYMLGLQTYQAAGGFSLYHTFRSAVWQRQPYGEYQFLGQGDSPQEILVAPLRLDYLKRSSTWIPLTIGALASWYIATHPFEDYKKRKLNREDPWFAVGFSYNAGTHEEAVFRGWLMPVLHEAGMSSPFANITQAVTFALMHLGSTPMPLPQFLLGLHLGSTTVRNSWSISESVFIHFWWDVFAFLGTYHVSKESAKSNQDTGPAAAAGQKISLLLPPIRFAF